MAHNRILQQLILKPTAAMVFIAAVAATARPAFAEPQPTADEDARRCAVVELYLRDDHPASTAVRETLQKLVDARQAVKLRIYRVDQAGPEQQRYEKLLQHFGVTDAQPPVVFSCGRILVKTGDAQNLRRHVESMLTVHAFVRSGCPHCAAAKRFLAKIEPLYPCFQFVQHDVVDDSSARDWLVKLTEHYEVQGASLPVFYLCNQLSVGFDSEETSGRRLDAILRKWTIPCPPEKEPARAASPRQQSKSAQSRAGQGGMFSVADDVSQGEDASRDPPPQQEDAAGDDAELPLPLRPDEELTPLGPTPDGDLAPLLPESDNPGAHNPLPAAEDNQDSLEVPLFGRLSQSHLGMPAFTFVVGLVDGFNPCAMWVLLFLLSVLVNLKSRTKILAVAGTFVVISGVAYYAFMAAWLNVFLFVGYLRSVQVILGLTAVAIGAVHIKDFFAFKKGISLSIPDAAKPTIYARVREIVMARSLATAISCAVVLAVLVNMVELLCTAGLPALYSEILMLQKYPAWLNYSYLGLYILAYMLDDILMVGIVVVTLSRHKLQEHEGRWLKLVSGAAIATLGVVMLVKPDWLV